MEMCKTKAVIQNENKLWQRHIYPIKLICFQINIILQHHVRETLVMIKNMIADKNDKFGDTLLWGITQR